MRKQRKSGRWLAVVLVLAAAVVAVWKFSAHRRFDVNEQPGRVEPAKRAPIGKGAKTLPEVGSAKRPGTPAPAKPAPPAPVGADAAEAMAAYDRGLEMLKADKLIDARSELCRAYFSGKLPPAVQNKLRRMLTELAETTLVGRGSAICPGDPYVKPYLVKPGEMLQSIERRLKLHVPTQILVKVNNLHRPEDLQAHRRYKMIYGPFHAIVYKSGFAMDIYLQRQGLEKVFVKRMRIGTGRNGSTPAGLWRVRLGGKNQGANWYPPPNSPLRGPIAYGHRDYAFGKMGMWMGLEGLDEGNRRLSEYGIHSTNDPGSIGRARSLGCIRLADDDIKLAYSLLYEHWSTVEVRP